MELIGQAPAGIQAGDAGPFESLGVLQTSRPVAAGDVSRLSLHLENDDAEPDECALCVTDLIGPRATGSRRRTFMCRRTRRTSPAAGRPMSRLRCGSRAKLRQVAIQGCCRPTMGRPCARLCESALAGSATGLLSSFLPDRRRQIRYATRVFAQESHMAPLLRVGDHCGRTLPRSVDRGAMDSRAGGGPRRSQEGTRRGVLHARRRPVAG